MRCVAHGVRAAGSELLRRYFAAERADQSGRQHDRRERHREHVDGDERGCGDCPQRRGGERARADAPRSVQDDCGDRGFDAVERARDLRHVAVRHVDPRQCDQDEKRWQHEQATGDDTAPRTMHEPADVGGELGRFRSGQHHAVVERMQKALLADPAAALDQLAVHDGDLPGRPTEADEAELQPETEGFGPADGCGRRRGDVGGAGDAGSSADFRRAEFIRLRCGDRALIFVGPNSFGRDVRRALRATGRRRARRPRRCRSRSRAR